MILLALFLDKLLGHSVEGIMIAFRSRFNQLPKQLCGSHDYFVFPPQWSLLSKKPSHHTDGWGLVDVIAAGRKIAMP
jgi:hypothetical protein